MSNLAFVVLLPNARRETVKVSLDTSILQVLEDICQKQGLNANEWNLKHLSRIIELGNSVRFSGLPNNATLEMVQSLKPRKDSAVTIVLQLESGKRLTHQFYPYETLWNVLEFWVNEGEKSVLPVDPLNSTVQPVCVYMRQDVVGRERLEKKTLRSLGLFQGSALIRLLLRTENQFRRQEVSVSTRSTSSSSRNHPHQSTTVHKMDQQQQQQKKQTRQVSTLNRDKVNAQPPDKDNKEKQSNRTFTNPPKQTSGSVNSQSQKKGTSNSSNTNKNYAKVHKTEQEASGRRQLHAQPGQLNVFDEFDAMLYHADDLNPVQIESPPDEFYTVTVQDAQSIYRDLQAKRKELEDAPFKTRSARNLEHDNAIQIQLSKHPITIVRIRFPDRYCLQGTFKTNATIRLLYSFVRNYLDNSQLNFYLFTTPPKKILTQDKSLIQEGLVRFAIVYFGTYDLLLPPPQRYVKETFCSRASDPEAVFRYSPQLLAPDRNNQVSRNRSNGGESEAEATSGPSNVQQEKAQEQTRNLSQEPAGPSSNNRSRRSSRPNNSQKINTTTIPKWFTAGKKS